MADVRIVFLPGGCPAVVEERTTLLEAAQKAGAGLAAHCGGAGSCGACRVRVPAGAPVSPPGLVEEQLLRPEELAAGIRLACQTLVLGSLHVEIPPESAAVAQRLQVGGDERCARFDPPTEVRDVDLPPPPAATPLSDWEILLRALGSGEPVREPEPGLGFLRRLGSALAEDRTVRLGLRHGAPSWVLPAGRRPLGLAVDLGTTKVAGYLVDMTDGAVLTSGGVTNPQIAYGEDVLSRITAVMQDGTLQDRLSRLVMDALGALAAGLCRAASERAGTQAPLAPGDITECVVVCNTVMHHLALGLNVQGLGLAPFRPVLRAPLECKAAELGLAVHPEANVYFPGNVSGFIGSDHLAMLLASGVGRSGGGPVLGIDIGTNSEISLCRGGEILSCSAASGSAFEGSTLRFGMRAADGAIEHVRVRDGRVVFQTVGGGKPVGLCGSGVLDAVARLRAAGAINRHGAFVAESPLVRRGPAGPEVVIAGAEVSRHGRDLTLSRQDVGRIQLSKGAIRTAIELLLRQAGMRAADLERFVVAGAFGTYLDVDSAMDVGMFPRLPRERFRQVGNSAGLGARLLLTSESARRQCADMAARIRHCELTGLPDFRSEFTRAMWL
jgi:uncharacterized 2Fe-2S/4Fe-4S cluster protein (DUF4445 family)